MNCAKEECIWVLMGKPEGKRPLGRSRRRWVNNIKMDRRRIVRGDMDCIVLAHDRDQWRALMNTVINIRVSENAGNFFCSCTTGGFSRRAQFHVVSYINLPRK
jgi:hypothetical protein